jgi:hypothetical protein
LSWSEHALRIFGFYCGAYVPVLSVQDVLTLKRKHLFHCLSGCNVSLALYLVGVSIQMYFSCEYQSDADADSGLEAVKGRD